MQQFCEKYCFRRSSWINNSILCYSLDFARTRLASDIINSKNGNERQFKGIIDLYTKILASDGIAGLYRGFVISCFGIFIYRGIYFGLYDTLKPILLKPDSKFIFSFFLAYFITITSGLMTYSIDTLKKRN